MHPGQKGLSSFKTDTCECQSEDFHQFSWLYESVKYRTERKKNVQTKTEFINGQKKTWAKIPNFRSLDPGVPTVRWGHGTVSWIMNNPI